MRSLAPDSRDKDSVDNLVANRRERLKTEEIPVYRCQDLLPVLNAVMNLPRERNQPLRAVRFNVDVGVGQFDLKNIEGVRAGKRLMEILEPRCNNVCPCRVLMTGRKEEQPDKNNAREFQRFYASRFFRI